MRNESFYEAAYARLAFAPADIAASGEGDGDWITIAEYRRVAVVFVKAAGSASDHPALSVQQATDASGTGARALELRRAWHNIGDADGGYTGVTVNADSYGDIAHAEGSGVIGTEVVQADLDDGYTHIRAVVTEDMGTAPAYAIGNGYATGDRVTFQGAVYEAARTIPEPSVWSGGAFGASYSVGDRVTFRGVLYEALMDNQNMRPDQNTDEWAVVAGPGAISTDWSPVSQYGTALYIGVHPRQAGDVKGF